MMHSIYTIVLVLAVLLLAGCSSGSLFDPKPFLLETELSYGPAEYRQGYKDGCESALGAYGNSMQKTVYGLRKDPNYQNSRIYNQVWKDSWAYCYMWLFVHRRQDSDSMHGTLF